MKKTTAERDRAEWDREIEADFQRAVASSRKRKCKKVEPFVMVPLWWIEETAKVAKSPTTLVLIELLRLHWKTKSLTFPLPNGRLQRLGVSRDVKRRVLHALERARFIVVERPARKTPLVTLVTL
jgi:hypothetical protein